MGQDQSNDKYDDVLDRVTVAGGVAVGAGVTLSSDEFRRVCAKYRGRFGGDQRHIKTAKAGWKNNLYAKGCNLRASTVFWYKGAVVLATLFSVFRFSPPHWDRTTVAAE